MSGWGMARIGLCMWCCITAFMPPLFAEDPLAHAPMPVKVGLILFPLLFFPVASVFVIGIQYVNPCTGERWTVPHWNSNFLNLRDPLHFLHLAKCLALAMAIGSVAALPFGGSSYLLQSLMYLSCFFGIHLGIGICIRMFGTKFVKREN